MSLTFEHAPKEDSLMLDSEVGSQNAEDGVLPEIRGCKVSRVVALPIVAVIALFAVVSFGQQRGLAKGAVSNDVELTEGPEWCYEVHKRSTTVGMTFDTIEHTDVNKCQEKCNEDNKCTAIAFASDRHHGGSGAAAYAFGTCMIKHSSVNVKPTNVRYHNLDLYVKGKKCKIPQPAADATAEATTEPTAGPRAAQTCTFDASRGHCHQEWLNHKNNGHPNHVPAPFCVRCTIDHAFGHECSLCCSDCQATTD